MVFPELCEQEETMTMRQIVQALSDQDLPGLPPGGGLFAKLVLFFKREASDSVTGFSELSNLTDA